VHLWVDDDIIRMRQAKDDVLALSGPLNFLSFSLDVAPPKDIFGLNLSQQLASSDLVSLKNVPLGVGIALCCGQILSPMYSLDLRDTAYGIALANGDQSLSFAERNRV
jgi:hypothetical protein